VKQPEARKRIGISKETDKTNSQKKETDPSLMNPKHGDVSATQQEVFDRGPVFVLGWRRRRGNGVHIQIVVDVLVLRA
jgi:hypothetical protein